MNPRERRKSRRRICWNWNVSINTQIHKQTNREPSWTVHLLALPKHSTGPLSMDRHVRLDVPALTFLPFWSVLQFNKNHFHIPPVDKCPPCFANARVFPFSAGCVYIFLVDGGRKECRLAAVPETLPWVKLQSCFQVCKLHTGTHTLCIQRQFNFNCFSFSFL